LDTLEDESGETVVLGLLETAMGGFSHLSASDAGPVDGEVIVMSELADEFALCAAVAIAERVYGIEFAHVVGGPVREGFDVEVLQVEFFEERLEERFQALANALDEGEGELAGACDFDRAEFAGPWVDVLEEVLVDAFEMSKIEFAAGWATQQLFRPPSGRCRFKLGQALEILQVPQVFKDVRSGVYVWVHNHGQVAQPWLCPIGLPLVLRQRNVDTERDSLLKVLGLPSER